MTEDKDDPRSLTQRVEEFFAAADAAVSMVIDGLVRGVNERDINAKR